LLLKLNLSKKLVKLESVVQVPASNTQKGIVVLRLLDKTIVFCLLPSFFFSGRRKHTKTRIKHIQNDAVNKQIQMFSAGLCPKTDAFRHV